RQPAGNQVELVPTQRAQLLAAAIPHVLVDDKVIGLGVGVLNLDELIDVGASRRRLSPARDVGAVIDTQPVVMATLAPGITGQCSAGPYQAGSQKPAVNRSQLDLHGSPRNSSGRPCHNTGPSDRNRSLGPSPRSFQGFPSQWPCGPTKYSS